jgi:hypothetical protein
MLTAMRSSTGLGGTGQLDQWPAPPRGDAPKFTPIALFSETIVNLSR